MADFSATKRNASLEDWGRLLSVLLNSMVNHLTLQRWKLKRLMKPTSA